MSKPTFRILVTYSIFISIVLFTAVTFFVNSKNRQRQNSERYFFLTRTISLQYESMICKVNLSLMTKLDSLSLSDTVSCLNVDKKLILLVPSTPCEDCVKEELSSIRSLSQKLGSENVVIMTQFPQIKDAKIWRKIWNVEFPVYNNSKELLFEKIMEQELFALFVLDSTMIPQHLFIPMKTLPKVNEEYYRFIVSEFAKARRDTVI